MPQLCDFGTSTIDSFPIHNAIPAGISHICHHSYEIVQVENLLIKIDSEITRGNNQIEVLRKIPIQIELIDNEFVAGMEDANIFSSGESIIQAVDNFKDCFFENYLYLQKAPPQSLGPGPVQSLLVMRKYLRIIENADH